MNITISIDRTGFQCALSSKENMQISFKDDLFRNIVKTVTSQEWKPFFDSYFSRKSSTEGSYREKLIGLRENPSQLYDVKLRDHCHDSSNVNLRQTYRDLLDKFQEIASREIGIIFNEATPGSLTEEAQQALRKFAIEVNKNNLTGLEKPNSRHPKIRLNFLAKSPLSTSINEVIVSTIQGEITKNDTVWAEYIEKDGPLLLEGATGTGKSSAIRYLQQAYFDYIKRRYPEYFKSNMNNQAGSVVFYNLGSAIDATTINHDILGWDKGAFTGAITANAGLFGAAQNGILFLDELQDAPLETQVQLLDLVNATSNVVTRTKRGADKEKAQLPLFVKVIFAINQPMDKLIEEGKLRPDLRFRFRNIIKLSSLNEQLHQASARGHLKSHLEQLNFLVRTKTACHYSMDHNDLHIFRPIPFDDSALELIKSYNWPGNHREFERVLSDIYYEIDHKKNNHNNIQIDANMLKKAGIDIPSLNETNRAQLSESTLTKIEVVKEVLRNCSTKKEAYSTKKLKDEKLGCSLTLNRFVATHIEHFPEELLRKHKFIGNA